MDVWICPYERMRVLSLIQGGGGAGSEKVSELNMMLEQMQSAGSASARRRRPVKHVGGVKRVLSLPPSRKGQTHNTSRAAQFCSPDRRTEADLTMTHAADAH